MATIEVPRNNFYKKQTIATGVTVKPQFTDMASSSDTTFSLNQGEDTTLFILSGTVPDIPSYGASALEGGFLRMYVSGVSVDNSRMTPEITGYLLNPEITLAEGAFSLANTSGSSSNDVVGNRLAVYSSSPHNDIPFLVEDFEGTPDEFQTINRVGGNTQLTLSDPFVYLSDFKKMFAQVYPGKTWVGDSYMREFQTIDALTPGQQVATNVYGMGQRVKNWGGGLKNRLESMGRGQGSSTNIFGIGPWTSKPNPDYGTSATHTNFGSKYRIEFKDSRKYFTLVKQSWPALTHWRLRNLQFSTQKYGRFVSWATTGSATIDYEAGSVGANKGNTAFRDVYSTRDFSNPYDSTSNDPMLHTTIELSNEKSLNGGQSLRMYHNWGYSDLNPEIQNLVVTSGNLNPQCARTSLYNIPFPKMPFDIAQSTYNGGAGGTVSTGDQAVMQGDTRGIVPEINIGINITKLAPNILLNASNSAGTTNYAGAYDYYTQATIATGSLSNKEQTFLRSVAITFSNYKPKDSHVTLDDFLNHGLSRFYGENGTIYDTENIVGGMVFARFGIDGANDSGQNVYGFPLAVTQPAQKPANMLRRMSGRPGGAGPMGGLTNLDCLTWGNTFTSNGPDSAVEQRFVQMPMNSWFNCKVYTDVFAYNNTGSASNKPYAPSGSENKSYSVIGEQGVIMRAIFDTQAGKAYVSGALKNPDVQDLPFIDIPFPAGQTFTEVGDMADGALAITSGSTTAADWLEDICVGQTVTGTNIPAGTVVIAVSASQILLSKAQTAGAPIDEGTFTFSNNPSWNLQDKPEFYPKHMTMWVQNYPWVTGATGLDFKFGDSAVSASGASRETEVFFDSVTLSNYSPAVTNLQPDAASGIMSLKPTSFYSPLGMQTLNIAGTGKFKKAWVGSPQLSITAACRVTEGSAIVSILPTGSNISTYELTNAGTVAVAGTGIPASTDIDSITDLETFVMDDDATASGDVTVTFTSTGTLQPAENRAELYQYNTGYNLCFGWDDKGDLPISVGGGLATFDAGAIIGTNADGTYYVTNTKYTVDPDTATSQGTLKVVVAGGGATATVTVSGAAMGAGYSVDDAFTLSGTAVGGSDDDDDAITVDVASVTAPFANDSEGYVLSNDYSTLNFSEVSRVLPNKNRMNTLLSGAVISKVAAGLNYDFLGADLLGSPVVDGGASFVPVSGSIFISGTSQDTNLITGKFKVHNANSTNQISLGTGANNEFISQDGFTQKGFMRVSVSDTNVGGTNYTDWGKRENVMVCTKVVDIPQMTNFDDDPDNNMSTNTIKVENSNLFNPHNPNETYRIFRMGEALSTSNYKGSLVLNTQDDIIDNLVTFTTQCSIATDDATPLLTEENLPQLYIGPEKYWISVLFDTPDNLVPRTYSSFCTINETPDTDSPGPVSGSTFNEFTYSFNETTTGTVGSSALYKRSWNLTLNADNDTYALGDFGYGPYDGESGLGGNVLRGPAFFEEFNYYNIGGVVDNGAQPKDSVPILISLLPKGDVNAGVTFFGDEYTTDTNKQPLLYWQFSDFPPAVIDFQCEPAFNLIEEDTDLYDLTTENLNAVRFNWSENDDDIWYRILMIDDDPIVDKYHRATMWIPLNESIENVSTAPSYTVYNPLAGTSAGCTEGSSVRAVLEGQGGWAAQLADTILGKVTVATGDNTNMKDLEAFTLILHWTPSVADFDETSYIATATTDITDVTGNFSVFKNSDNNIQVKLGADIDMTGSSSVVCDGDVPTSIIITFDKNASSATKAKLYVDGIMVANSTGSTEQTTTADFVVGGVYHASYRGTTGFIEEVVLHNKAYEVPEESGTFLFNTVNTLDKSGARDVTHNARLFAADYHNFRGVSSQEIGMSGYTSWRCTTL